MPTVINLRGTSGAGKSTVVRRLMEKFAPCEPIEEVGRRQPSGYMCQGGPGRSLYVPGHYETPCGGCDTIKTPDRVYELVWSAAARGADVIYEGIIIQDDTKRLLALNEKHPVNVIELSTPIEECLEGIQQRRDARNDVRPLNPGNTISRALRVHRICDKLRAQGLEIPYLGREGAYQHCLKLLYGTAVSDGGY